MKTKIITVTLSEEAATYYALVAQKIGDGKRKPIHSDVLNYCMESLALFDEHAGESLMGWLNDNYHILLLT